MTSYVYWCCVCNRRVEPDSYTWTHASYCPKPLPTLVPEKVWEYITELECELDDRGERDE